MTDITVEPPSTFDTVIVGPNGENWLDDDGIIELKAQKESYLCSRAVGFSIAEAARLAGAEPSMVTVWRKLDPEFRRLEDNELPKQSRRAPDDALRMEFIRNMRLVMNRDFKILYKASLSLDTLSPVEYDYLKRVRKHYTIAELLNLERAMLPEGSQASATAVANVTVMVDSEVVEGAIAARAAAMQLLERFQVNAQVATVTQEPTLDPFDSSED